jgi:hypothetical protein
MKPFANLIVAATDPCLAVIDILDGQSQPIFVMPERLNLWGFWWTQFSRGKRVRRY